MWKKRDSAQSQPTPLGLQNDKWDPLPDTAIPEKLQAPRVSQAARISLIIRSFIAYNFHMAVHMLEHCESCPGRHGITQLLPKV